MVRSRFAPLLLALAIPALRAGCSLMPAYARQAAKALGGGRVEAPDTAMASASR
ncbi:hypothetical protein [Xanthomonas medicagonis]|uniref:hypothetical protein n=1 Tax=Xanthomonas medicagonis TaxID=3160841 RepID=UPI003517ABD7